MDHTDADNVKPTDECHEVHNVDEYDILVGKLFSSRDQAWYFYKGFAQEHGFSARRGTTRLDMEGNVKAQEFCCSKEGFRESKVNIVDRQRAHTPITRTGCKHLDYTYLPGSLIQSKWTKDSASFVDLIVPQEIMQMARFASLRATTNSVNRSSVLNNVRDPQRKQRKRKKVTKNKVEKKIRRCGFYNGEGHNKLTCPQVKLGLNTSTQSTSTDFFEDEIEWL
ncbi:hypothetical protein F3Y22_tig00110627pilonHSYRG00031 [Hibiscus syriacus]|uniref:FAR1 domain-containing protein n=1 Tax=Hibiscus syriacus TaxID=106335 RepID=A0A6A2ZYW6_HIBSY|nr:hypothetical protein F3Y22_tig00110627pilonHSYRG00031 [Hibiscus syriacus]